MSPWVGTVGFSQSSSSLMPGGRRTIWASSSVTNKEKEQHHPPLYRQTTRIPLLVLTVVRAYNNFENVRTFKFRTKLNVQFLHVGAKDVSKR